MFGVHVSKEDLIKTIQKLTKTNATALQFFSTSPRTTYPANIENYTKHKDIITKICSDNEFSLIIHSAYTVNLSKELMNGKRKIDISDSYSINILKNDLIIADMLNCKGVVFHTGKYTTSTAEKGTELMKRCILHIIDFMKDNDLSSPLILETASGQGTELFHDIDDLIHFYNSFAVEHQKYFKICFDTCHVWSSGFGITDAYNKIQEKTNNAIVAIHLNNSKTPKGSRKDRHENIFNGTIPLEEIKTFIQSINIEDTESDTKFKLPIIILETPTENFNEEIEQLEDIYYNESNEHNEQKDQDQDRDHK
jgi:deoxyribonuclease-4